MGLVNLIVVDNHGDSQVACQLEDLHGKIVASNDSHVGQMVLSRPLSDGDETFTADDGVAFLMILHQHYSGSRLRASKYLKSAVKVFCPTGPGGGVDPTCGSGGVRKRYASDIDEATSKAEYKSLQEKQKIVAQQAKDLKSKAKQTTDHAEKQRFLAEAATAEHQEKMIQFDAMTHRQVHNAVDRQTYLQEREHLAKLLEDHHAASIDLRQRLVAAGVQKIPDEYMAKHGLETGEVNPYDVWREGAAASAFGEPRTMAERLKAVSKKYSGVTEEHLLESDKLFEKNPNNWWMGRTDEKQGMQNAYYGEPKEVTRRVGGPGPVDAVVPAKVQRGGADENVKAFMESAEIGIQMKPQALGRFITSGEMKNGFQKGAVGSTGKGKSGYFGIRRDAENEMFGEIDDDAKRPVYGYLEHPDRMRSQGAEVGSNYGKVQLVLKSDVKSRATYTVGDSLDDQQLWGKVVGAVNDPASHRNLKANYTPESIAQYQWKKNIEANLNSNEWKLVESYVDQGKAHHAERARPQYLETQVFGGVKLSDIREMRIPEGVEITPAQWKKLDKAGVAVVKIPPAFSPTFHYSIPDWDAAFKDDE